MYNANKSIIILS